MYSVYALTREGIVFYVGMSKNVASRISNHRWLWDFPIEYLILSEGIETKEQAATVEKGWIEKYVGEGVKLYNFKHNIKAEKRRKERNGKVYIGGWLDKDIVSKGKEMAKLDSRTFSSYIEIALSYHNDRDV